MYPVEHRIVSSNATQVVSNDPTYSADALQRKIALMFSVFKVGYLHVSIYDKDVATAHVPMNPTKIVQSD